MKKIYLALIVGIFLIGIVASASLGLIDKLPIDELAQKDVSASKIEITDLVFNKDLGFWRCDVGIYGDKINFYPIIIMDENGNKTIEQVNKERDAKIGEIIDKHMKSIDNSKSIKTSIKGETIEVKEK